MSSEIFISEFHNIGGVLVGERKRNVQKLLRNTIITDDEEKLILNKLEPKTYLETLLHIDILIYLKKTSHLLEILKNGNPACVNKIIKQPWFFQEAFNNVTAEELVEDILPSMSFSVKMKLLKKLSRVFPEEKVDKIFDAVVKRYGLFIATTVIPGCSSQKIQDILKNNEVKLWARQLKIIYNKEPNLIVVYLDVHKPQKIETLLDNNFLIYLAQRDPAYFWKIMENHEFNNTLKLGRRTTKKTVTSKKHEIINEPKKYIKYLRHETLVRNMNKQSEFKQLYHNLFPRNMEKLENGNVLCNNLLKYHPDRGQYELFKETFNAVMNENIISNLSCLDDYFLKLIADIEVRQTLAQLKYKESNDNEYIKYYEAEKCFTLIKDKINVTASIVDRSKLLCILAKSCAVNKDLKWFEKVLKYFCERHMNDDRSIRNTFLDTIVSNFKLEDFNATHWKYLSEIFTYQSLNKEFSGHNSELKTTYIKYLYKNNGSVEEIIYVVLDYIKDQIVRYGSSWDSFTNIKDSKIEKEILMQAVEHFPRIIKVQKMEHEKSYTYVVLMAEIFEYNVRNPKDKIMVFENEKLIETLRNTLQNDYIPYTFQKLFSKAVCKLNRNDFENEMLNEYWEKSLSRFSVDHVIRWYLKHDPLVIVENFEQIMKAPAYTTSKIWSNFKLYSHLSLDQLVVKYCAKKLNSDEDINKTDLVLPLSFLASPEYYVKIMENGNLIPTSPKLVLTDINSRIIYKLQQTFIQKFKNLKDPIKFLPMFMDTFCRGDYLQESLLFLYSAFYKCPENELKPYLDKLLKNNAMSTKKHALNLACCVLDQRTFLQTLSDFEENNKNKLLQKCMFLSTLRYFSKNPCKELLQKVVFLMGLLEDYDPESLKVLHTVYIYRNYRPYYIQNILKLLEKFKENDEDKSVRCKPVISSILDLIDAETIKKLPQDFCKEIIQHYFLINDEINRENISGIFPFVVNFLMYHGKNNFEFVFQLLSSYKSQFWNNYSMVKERENIYTFFRTVYKKACEKEITLEFVEQFSSNWKKIFTPVETFEEYILLNLLTLKYKSEKETEAYSKEIVLFSEKLVEEFGQIVLSKFITILSKCISVKKKERNNMLLNMLKFRTTRLNCIIVMELIILKQDLFYKDKIRRMYHDIDSILKEITDPKVQLFYNLYLKK